MHKLKESLPSSISNRGRELLAKKTSTPYDEMPITLKFQHMRPFSEILSNSQYCLSRKEKVRNITHKTLERDFKETHDLYQGRENGLLKTFKIRCKRKEQKTKLMTNQQFFADQLQQRQIDVRKLNEEYLSIVKLQISKGFEQAEGEEEKIIGEYNLIYEYRAEHIPSKLFGRAK